MTLCIPPQPDCATAWLRAALAVYKQPRHEAHNVLIDIADPIARVDRSDPIVSIVEGLLKNSEKSVFSIANTIFPERALPPTRGAGFHRRIPQESAAEGT